MLAPGSAASLRMRKPSATSPSSRWARTSTTDHSRGLGRRRSRLPRARATARAIRRGPVASEARTGAPPRRWWASRHIGQVGRAIAFVGDYNTSAMTYDIAIIGGGIVGLATARALLEQTPSLKLVLCEKESELGRHQTGHNSGVIHSGIYYKPGSFKARLCVEGARLMVEFCEAHGIRVDRCGKVIVATSAEE